MININYVSGTSYTHYYFSFAFCFVDHDILTVCEMDRYIRIAKAYKGIFILLFITFCLILPLCFHKNPNSLYFTNFGSSISEDSLRKENSRRLKHAEVHFKKMRDEMNSNKHFNTNKGRIDVAIVVITTSRNRHKIDEYEPKYLTQTLMKLYELRDVFMNNATPAASSFNESTRLKTESDEEDNNLKWSPNRIHSLRAQISHNVPISVCNVDHDIASYYEATLMESVAPFVNRFSKHHRSTLHVLEKEKQDYVFCLNHSLQLNPRYVMLVEDDAFPLDNLFPVLFHTIHSQLDAHIARGELHEGPRKEIAFVKFFHPERLQSYFRPDLYRPLQLFAMSVTLSSSVVLIYSVICKYRELSIHITWALWTFYFIALLVAIGHPNVAQLRSIFEPYLYSCRPAPSCCTQAMLFPTTTAVSVINYMQSKECSNGYGKDSILDDLQRDLGLQALFVEPNVFQHIGMYSTLRKLLVDPLNV